jgi:D-arabinose 1-dehydrogenase-like Zn-dependent alcohol dehydrogenase
MITKYRAVQVTKPGKLEIVEKATTEPASGQVRIRVEACGVCHIEVNPTALLFGMRSVVGTMTGSPIDAEDTLSFSSQQGIHPMIETFGLERAPEAYERMMNGHARFRIVLTVGE